MVLNYNIAINICYKLVIYIMENIIIYPQGGLCNKLRVTLSYYQYAKKQNKKLIVIWSVTDACNGFFLDYFEPIENISFIKNNNQNLKIFYNGFSIHPDFEFYIIPELKLLSIMFDEVKRRIDILENNYIAVHIRRTDHIIDAKKNKLYTSDEDFFDFIDKNITKNVYIATDNKDTYNIYKNKYKDKIKINYTNELCNSLRHTTLKESIIDLYMCVYSNNFKGSGWSSFTDTIYQLRGLHNNIIII